MSEWVTQWGKTWLLERLSGKEWKELSNLKKRQWLSYWLSDWVSEWGKTWLLERLSPLKIGCDLSITCHKLLKNCVGTERVGNNSVGIERVGTKSVGTKRENCESNTIYVQSNWDWLGLTWTSLGKKKILDRKKLKRLPFQAKSRLILWEFKSKSHLPV